MSWHEAQAMEARQTESAGETHMAGVLTWISEIYCGLHGHDSLLKFESDRMFLKCASCGHESPGWELTEPAPTERVASDPRRHVRVRITLVSSRRVA